MWVTRLSAIAVVGAFLIEVPSWGSASLIEVVWTLIGAATTIVSLWSLPRVVGDWRLAKRGVHGPALRLIARGHVRRELIRLTHGPALRLIARGHVRRELIRLTQGLIILVIGIYACATPSPVPGPVLVSITGLVITGGLLGLGALVALESILDRRQRREAEDLLRRR